MKRILKRMVIPAVFIFSAASLSAKANIIGYEYFGDPTNEGRWDNTI